MEWVSVGKFTKTHGLKGELKFHLFWDDPEIITEIKKGLLKNLCELESKIQIEQIRTQGKKWIVKIEGCDSIDDAKTFVGHTLKISNIYFPPLPEGEFYWFEIEGLKVFDESGRYHGIITEIIATGSNDVYVVKNEDKELLLPMIDSVVKTIDLEKKVLIFHVIEGLLEDHPV